MNHSISRSLTTLLLIGHFSTQCRLSLSKSSDTLSRNKNTQTYNKMLVHRPGQHLRIINPLGGITVVADANADQISVHAIQSAKDSEALSTIFFECTQNNKGPLIRACADSKAVKARTEITAIVPIYTPLQILANGPVHVSDPYGPVHILAYDSSVEVKNPHNITRIRATGKGAIRVSDAKDHIKAEAEQAPIIIKNSCKSVLASCEMGNITLSPNELPEMARINATINNRGHIHLAMPTELEAAMSAYTEIGQVTCELPITIDPFITKLDKKAWETFKRKVEGYRNSAVASISTRTKKGNVKIVEKNRVHA